MTKLSSYPKVYALGHRDVQGIFDHDYYIEEKIDGSQISFGLIGGELLARSRGAELFFGMGKSMFDAGLATIKSLDLHPDLVFRGEYLSKPKHNCLTYGRVPRKNIIIFNVEDVAGNPLPRPQAVSLAEGMGLEHVPLIDIKIRGFEDLERIMDTESILGGVTVEGFVIKAPSMTTRDKKYAVAKFVSEKFKEKNQSNWKKENPGRGDVVQEIINTLKTEARWNKAVQHLRESGQLDGSPKDIGPLLKELQTDLEQEETDWIKERLFAHFIKQIKRGVAGGLPEWYKMKLAENCMPQE